jgi:hypothetical protein
MTTNTKEQFCADWVVTQNVGHFQKRLNAEAEDSKYRILAQLLSSELAKIKLESRW